MAITMHLLSAKTHPRTSFRRGGAFTLIEIVIALAVLGAMASGCYLGFNAINTYAVTSRLYSEAQAAAHNQVDLLLSKGPFDRNGAYISGSFDPTLNKIPVELMTTAELDALASSGVTFPTSVPTATPALSSSYYPYFPYYRTGAGQPIKKQAFIYQDPVTGTVTVIGTLTSTVTETGMTMSFALPSPSSTPSPLNTRRASTAVTYSFRNRNYTVAMDTLRTADQ
jgi:prepilin-type N-terminal cleavage/methylation domain-containing protein